MTPDATGVTAGPLPRAGGARFTPAALLPATATLGLGQRTSWLVRAGFTVLAAALMADAMHVLFGLGGQPWESAMRGVVPALANVVAAMIVATRAVVERERRRVWILVAAAFGSYAIGFTLWGTWIQHEAHPPDPSLADGFWGAMYPLMIAAMIVAGRGYRAAGVTRKIWLDGILAATAVAAVGLVFVVPPLVHSAHRNHVTVVVNALYPLADLVFGVVMVTLIGIRGWQLDRKWTLVIAAFTLWLVADCLCSVQIIGGATTGDSTATLCYIAAFLSVALAAWQPEIHPDGQESTHWSTLVLPLAFTLTAPAILLYDHFKRISVAALILTWLALLVAMLRMALALRETLSFKDVQRAALTDDLTELPNRRMFLSRLRQRLDEAERAGGRLTMMMLDLDNFKQLNDTLGHDAGDELLRMIGPRLTRATRERDTVARLGGDEFAILLAPGSEDGAATDVARAVLAAFGEPFRVHGLVLRLTASIGIASFPHHAGSAETLLKCADVAMYEAKRSRNGYERYSSDRDVYTRERLELSGELAEALDSDAIEAVFQPIADTCSRRIIGAEALVRWRLPDGSLRSPGEFLEAAEMAGLSRPLTRRMLDLALAQVRDWHAAGHDIYVSLNAAVADLLDETFPDEIAAALTAHGLSADALTVEVTESSIVANPARVGAGLMRLRELGVQVALDDFGTGYSSLTHLRELPVDLVKIDRSFVARMCDEPTDAAIVYATIELAHRLDLHVVAEGVEDERTWQALIELGSDRIQGYGLSRPLESQAFSALLTPAPARSLGR